MQDVVGQERFLDVTARAEQFAGRDVGVGDFGDDSGRAENRQLRAERGEQVTAVTLAPMRTPIGSEPEKATMQLLHQTCRSRIDRLKAAAVIGGSSEKYGDQQRFSAPTSSSMSSVRQKR